VRVVDLRDGLVGEHRRALWMLFGAVALVLLIACADMAHLLLARAAGRRREMAIRAALGATRASLLRRLLLESLMLALAGGALGTLLAWWGQRLLLVLGATNLPRAAEAAIDGRALAFALAASLVCAILFGLAPAWAAADGVGGRTLRESVGVAGGAASGRRLRNALVSGEVALALVLLIGAGLFLRSLLRVLDVKPGFDVAHALIVRLALPPATYPDSPSVTRFSEEAERRVAALPGVQASGFINIPPMSGSDLSVEFTVVGTPPVAREQVPRTHYRVVTPGALGALGIPLVAGRGFDARDKRDATPVLLINRHLARRFFPQRDPIGQQLTLDDNDSGPRALEIAGVVGDVSQFGPDREPTFDVYLPLAQSHPDIVGLLRNGMHLVVRSAHDPRALAVPLKRALRSVDADVPATRSWTMEEALAGTVAPRRFNVWVLGGFAAAALVLAAAGIAAVVGYSVSQRRREIGIRLALGAPPRDVRRLVAAQSMRPALVGLGLGLSAALALTRVVGSLVFEVSPADPWTFAAAILLLAAVAFLACWLPAARAARVDPLIALRSE
jgi:putative ABC transport system permease protein